MSRSTSLLVAVSLALLLAAPSAASAQSLSEIRTIVLDPGHGGSNEGALGVAGIYERELTLATSRGLRDALIERFPEVEVRLTRESDIDLGLSDRTHYANLHGADLFISIHYNAAEGASANGLEVYYLSADEPTAEPLAPAETLEGPGGIEVASILFDLERTRLHQRSALLAETLHEALLPASGLRDRGVKQAQFRVLRGAHMPCVVVELGFLTHPEEGVTVVSESYTEAIVEAFVGGIEAFEAQLAAESTAPLGRGAEEARDPDIASR